MFTCIQYLMLKNGLIMLSSIIHDHSDYKFFFDIIMHYTCVCLNCYRSSTRPLHIDRENKPDLGIQTAREIQN